MHDPIVVQYHVEDRLPAGAVSMIEDSGCRIDVYLSREHPLEVTAECLGQLVTDYLAHLDGSISHLALTG